MTNVTEDELKVLEKMADTLDGFTYDQKDPVKLYFKSFKEAVGKLRDKHDYTELDFMQWTAITEGLAAIYDHMSEVEGGRNFLLACVIIKIGEKLHEVGVDKFPPSRKG